MTKPPTYFGVISFEDTPSYEDCSRWLRAIHKRNKYHDETYQYYTQVELGGAGNFHIHFLPITALTQNNLRESVKRVVTVNTDVYLKPCANPQATARYISKDMKGYAGVSFPRAWKGRGRRLTCCSRGFLSASRAALSAQSIKRFAEKRECSSEFC